MSVNPSVLDQFVSAIVYRANIQNIADLGNPSTALHAGIVVGLICATAGIIWYFKGRTWAFVYVALIPALNWSFGNVPNITLIQPNTMFEHGVLVNPLTMVTGLVFVLRDFVQREIGHKVLAVMALAIAWSFYYSWPVIAIASGIAFAISETADWMIYTFTKYRLSTRILLSSALAAPIDTTVFLYGADLAKVMAGIAEPGSEFHAANWVVFVIGKMVGAVLVSWMIRMREDRGEVDPKAL
ncbi:hypothetical protein [Ponticaulis sp.]|uniref:hypothetical protein n=1 Tax=Ponticaulis sp. TaxID=2020902 RepID=UPI000C986688|nr:hypothetical protein [Ponticaulis sp.]MAI91380.1 hypothetical protein [Ponticaulis sp.]|tara:strand:+ start:11321 stop:12043 length:723 start_codon:yes stop_codon:yes gene_type:complete